ncbi:MAG TPA: hypothetical protein VFT90_10050 [Chryseosolibacter sp.]|nr:hypothetical protein [Chryseosolibacter sp.]
MDEKISLEAIAAYGDAYADKVSKSFFSSKNKITGEEILTLCNVAQVNLFVVRELLFTWKEEAKKLKSPYFDYDHPEAREALDQFMAVISKHISVTQDNFLPLLRKAVRQTLLLIFNPYDFFSTLVTGKNNRVELPQFKEEIKYLKINKAPLVRLVQRLEEKGVSEIRGNEAFAVLDEILEEVSFTPEDLEEHIRQFSEVLPLDPARFFPAPQPSPYPEQNHFVKEPAHREEKKIIIGEPVKAKENPPLRPILNDKIQPNQRPAVYNNFQKIPRIKDHLTINQKFMFTKVLFYGDFESFSKAIDELDQQRDMDSAMAFLEKQSANWDRESREFHEFMEMVEKRFQ